MKCPLQRFTVRYKQGETKIELMDCIKEECAWWTKRTESDGRVYGSCTLVGLVDLLHNLVMRMPRGN